MFNAVEPAIDVCRLAANNKIYTVVIDIGSFEYLDFIQAFHEEMEANALTYSTTEIGANFNEVIVRGVLPA